MGNLTSQEKILNAIEKGRVNDVKTFLDKGFDPNFAFQDRDGETPMYFAALYGHKDVVALLISRGANVNQADENGLTSLYIAARYGHKDVVALLIVNGANVNQADKNGWTPLYFAAWNDHKEVVVLLIANGANLNQADKDGRTPLHIAARNCHKDVVALLIANGANFNQATNDGRTPLHIAAECCHIEIISLLLQVNADVDCQTKDGLTPLMIATQHNHKGTADLLIKAIEKLIIHAVKSGNLSQLVSLLPQLKNANVIDENGNTLLHLAIANNQPLALNMLLELPAIQMDLYNQNKQTPFVLAMKLRNRQMIKIINEAINKSMQYIDIEDVEYDSKDFLGNGVSGVVYKGTYKNEMVAIKKIPTKAMDSDEFEREIMAMLHCRSPYLLHLVGVVELHTHEPKLVLQYMDGGDLRNHLNNLRNNELTVTNYSTLEIIWAIANGLADLHHNNCVHRDLKSHNVLLSSKHYVKLADLGSTRTIADTMTQGAGTLYWTAPEVFKETGHYGAAADIYSFGVVLTELETLAMPYSDGTERSQLVFMNGVCDGSLRPALSTKCTTWYKKLVEECLDNDPSKRPTAADIIKTIDTHIANHSDIHLPMDPGSETSLSSSSVPSTAMISLSPLPEIATTVNCQSCQESNSIVNEACRKCNAPLLQAAVKVNILIQRFKKINIDASYFCSLCGSETAIQAIFCHQCHVTLSNADKVNQLVARSAMHKTSPPYVCIVSPTI